MIGLLRRHSTAWRAAAAVLLVAGLGLGGSALGLGGTRQPVVHGQLPAAGPAPGQVVRDAQGRPILDAAGKPVRVGSDGRTLVDSKGRVLRTPSGKPLRVGAGVPTRVIQRAARRHRRPHRNPSRDPGAVVHRPSPLAPKAPARDTAPVLIGLAYQDPGASLAGIQTQYDQGEIPDGGAIGRAVVNYVNATGGVLGREMRLRLYRYNAEDGRPYDATWAEICAFFNSAPRPVFVTGNGTSGCYEPNGIAFGAAAPWTSRVEHFVHSRLVFDAGGIALDRYPPGFIAALKEKGFFGPGTRVGFGYARGSDDDAATEQAMRSALEAAGANVVEEVGVEVPKSATDAGPAVRDIGNAVVRFRAAGVDRVVTADRGVGLGIFMQAAEAQGYRPRYAVATTNAPNSLIANGLDEQLRDSLGIGWEPLMDVDTAHDPGPPGTREECIEILSDDNVTVGGRGFLGAFASLSLCDAILMARAAMERSGEASGAGILRGLEGISRPSAMPLATRLDAAHHDGAAAYRVLLYHEGCACFAYDGPDQPFD